MESTDQDVFADVPVRGGQAAQDLKLDLNELLATTMSLQTDIMKCRETLTIQAKGNQPAIDSLTAILESIREMTALIEIAVEKNRGPDFSNIIRKFASWSSLAWVITTTLNITRVEVDKLPKKTQSGLNIAATIKTTFAVATTPKNLDPLLQDLKTINSLLPTVIEITFGNIKSSELEKHIQTSYANPFWYGFQSQTRAFRDVINLLKATFASAATETNFIRKGLAGAKEAMKAAVTSSKKQSEVSHELLKRGASVDLLKAMWNVPESGLGAFATKATNPAIKVANKIFLAVPHSDAQVLGFDQVEVLVLSPRKLPFGTTSEFAINWTGLKCKSSTDPSIHDGKHLIIHFHGGGFVASTPYSHEPYLRNWVNACGAMMLSVNYTKAPEKQYPFAVNECYAVYKAAMDYFEPTKVVVSGDSAGGNLCLAVALMAAKNGIRTPDGILASYPAADLTKAATVSRLVFAQDIMLPYDILALASDSYVSATSHPETDYALSPVYADEDLIKKLPDSSCFLSGALDPLLDDCSRFVARMRDAGKRPQWYLYDLPHGFLNFAAILPTAAAAIEQGSRYLKQFFQSN